MMGLLRPVEFEVYKIYGLIPHLYIRATDTLKKVSIFVYKIENQI